MMTVLYMLFGKKHPYLALMIGVCLDLAIAKLFLMSVGL